MDGRRRQQWQLLMRPWKNKNVSCLFLILISLINVTTSSHEDCPWYQQDQRVADEIKSNCICATNPSSDDQLSIQCQDVHAQTLVSVLLEFEAGTRQPLELLYLNGSRVTDDDGAVPSKLFGGLKITSLQLSGCNIKSVHNEAFTGTEEYLKHLSLAQNEIGSVPTGAFEKLNRLSLLDLGYNKITKIPAKAFHKLIKLATLKLNDNNVELHHEALFGLEGSLRNLNLKGTRISHVPDAVANLSSLAFLDMAQNRLRELNPSHFLKLHSLTALNLERNLLQTLPETVFEGINDTLSSLSLLNNLITNFPQRALKNLRELRVLDLGFNLLTHVDDGAFDGLKSLTLLALDGNPLSTLSEKSFASLNTTLRGISLGGRFLNCDCRMTWILEWIQLYDLQVTSRERNPQFCGSPENLRSFTFYQIQPDDLICPKNETEKKPEYDVNLSPEDIALLGMSSVHVSQSASTSTSVEQSSSNQETMESNKPTFTLEIPNNNGHKNATIVKYKTRRPRPNPSKFPPKVVFTTSTNAPVSKNEESVENTAQEISSSEIEPQQGAKNNETNDQEPTASTKKESQQTLIHAANLTTTSTSTTTTTTKKPFVPSSRHPIRNPLPIRPNPVRHRIAPKIISTTPTPTTSTNFDQDQTNEDEDEQKELFVISSSTTTVGPLFTHQSSTNNNKPKKPPALQRQPTSKTIDAVEIDDSKIPVISGIGSAVSSPNLNTGSIMTVKQPSPIQTQHNNARELDNTMHPSMIHQVPHVSRQPPPNLIFADKSEIVVKEISRNGDSIMLYWESPRQAAGFRIIYRFFGEDTFRHGPPLAATETEYRIKNIPTNECMVVCVVPYEEILYNEISPSAATVPPGSQCREVKPSSPSALMNHMDKITIGASAAICVTVLIAVLIFIAITKRAKRPPSTLMAKIPPTSYLTPSPGPNMVTSSGGYGMASKEWDQMSVVSTKSIPRARVYHGSMDGLANPPPPLKTATLNPHFYRGGLDGPSPYRSFTSTHHHHHNHNTNSHAHNYHHNHATNTNSGHTLMHGHGTTATAVSNYLNNQNRLLRTSLGSRASFDALNKLSHTRHSHHQLDHVKRKRSSRLNQSESLNTLNGYETPDNWTDHDMDFYVARNHTRHDLVQL